MSAEFWITIAAIIVGPVFAVIIAQVLQRREESKQRKLFVFRALMTSRKTPLSPERVTALNLVEIEFFRHARVLSKFRELLEIYNDLPRWESPDEATKQQTIEKVDDKSAELLGEIGRCLGYKLENLELLRGGYYPRAFSYVEQQQHSIREFLVALNEGRRSLPIAVVDYRHSEQILEQARATDTLLQHAAKIESAPESDQ